MESKIQEVLREEKKVTDAIDRYFKNPRKVNYTVTTKTHNNTETIFRPLEKDKQLENKLYTDLDNYLASK
jgi:hypothetical protein